MQIFWDAKRVIIKDIMQTAARIDNFGNRLIFEPLGLTSATGKILALLYHRQSMNSSEILAIIGGTKSNISQRIKWLKSKKFVSFSQEIIADKRRTNLVLTPTGKKKVDEVIGIMKEASLNLNSLFTEEEKRAFFSFFKKLNKVLDEFEDCLKAKGVHQEQFINKCKIKTS